MRDEELSSLGERIEQLTARPHDVRAPLVRIARPLLRALGYRPALRTARVTALLDALRAPGGKPVPEARLTGAVRELEDNVIALERTLVVHGRVPLAHAAWVRRLYEVTVRAARAARDQKNEAARRVAAAIDPVRIAPPLAITPGDTSGKDKPPKKAGKDEPATAAPEASEATDTFLDKPLSPEEERLVEVELLAIDHLLDAARGETEFLSRKRRLLESARKLLLDASAALPLGKEGVEVRRRHLAMEIARIDRLEAAGLSPHRGLLHQAKDALARGERQRLHAALVALDGVSLAAGDEGLSAATSRARQKLGEGEGEDPEADKLRSLRRSSEEMFGGAAMAAIAEGYVKARKSQTKPPKGESDEDQKYRLLALQWLAPENEAETHAALCAIDGTVDVGVPLAPVRVSEVETRVRIVRHPTPDLLLMPARDVLDIPHAVIEDPRTVLLALAEGRLLARRYVEQEVKKRTRTRLVGEARIYVLDGSSSMLEDGKKGARARVRDAILLAELGMLVKRFAEGDRSTRLTLHYRYFTKKIGPISRISKGKEAIAAMADVVGTVRKGGTDIENALLSSFEQIRAAKDEDPDLARAQIVLVTDGDAVVREDVIQAAREKVGDVPIAVSVVALGEENEALRALVARQRARGERAFYHFLDDDALVEICEGKLFTGPKIHVEGPPDEENLSVEARAARLRAELGGLVDELGALAEKRSIAAIEAMAAEADASAEASRAEAALGVPADTAAKGEGSKALREAIEKDRRALEARFLRWFPAPAAEGSQNASTGRSSDCEAVIVVLSTIAEVVADFGGSDLSRRAEAIDLLERLLPDAMLTPARWFAVMRDEAGAARDAMRTVHAAVTGPRSVI
ncbi:hypothetical protein KEG38_02245 [Polyangium jinanense]|uniref:hypothetical protein n=1 Tax=Polyangium jinanense TaxID=2829994 RepID=UPI0023414220|nr:hypothetical protein [Polyangium jinanense]MDC3952643.1 hypothetical protein [Polyangium jinanense]